MCSDTNQRFFETIQVQCPLNHVLTKLRQDSFSFVITYLSCHHLCREISQTYTIQRYLLRINYKLKVTMLFIILFFYKKM